MAKRKVCKQCRKFTEGQTCENCGSSSFTTAWHGRLHIIQQDKSVISEKIGIEKNGEYAIKTN